MGTARKAGKEDAHDLKGSNIHILGFQKDAKINDKEIDNITESLQIMKLRKAGKHSAARSPAKHHAHTALHHIHTRDVRLMAKLVLIVVERIILPNHKPARRFPSGGYKATRTEKLVQKGIRTIIRKMKSQ